MPQSILGRVSATQTNEPTPVERAKAPENTLPTLAVSIGNAAKMLGIGRSTAYVLKERGDLPTFVLGGKTLVSVKNLEGMVARLTCSTVSEGA